MRACRGAGGHPSAAALYPAEAFALCFSKERICAAQSPTQSHPATNPTPTPKMSKHISPALVSHAHISVGTFAGSPTPPHAHTHALGHASSLPSLDQNQNQNQARKDACIVEPPQHAALGCIHFSPFCQPLSFPTPTQKFCFFPFHNKTTNTTTRTAHWPPPLQLVQTHTHSSQSELNAVAPGT
jgi:hypothetical protein